MTRIMWTCAECGKSGLTPALPEDAPMPDAKSAILAAHYAASPKCLARVASIDAEFVKVDG